MEVREIKIERERDGNFTGRLHTERRSTNLEF